jgi:hypothetical protein
MMLESQYNLNSMITTAKAHKKQKPIVLHCTKHVLNHTAIQQMTKLGAGNICHGLENIYCKGRFQYLCCIKLKLIFC